MLAKNILRGKSSPRVSCRLEAVNGFNTPIFRAPNMQFGNPSFGRVTSQANFARIVQLSLRLMW